MTMRAAPLLLAVLALVLASCAKAEDVADGDEPDRTVETTTASPTSPQPTTSAPTSSAPAQTESTEPAVAPTPKVGNCYATSKAAFNLQRDGSFPVPCAKRHSAETYLVVQAGASPSSREIDRAWRRCHDRFQGYVGGSATVSTLGIALSMPGSDQVSAGQSWIRCDVIEKVNFNGKGGKQRVGSLRSSLADSVPDRFRGCSKRWPKVLQKVHFSPCDQFHQAELIPESERLGGTAAAYPGVAVARNRSAGFCERVVLDHVPEALRYYYYYPTRGSWPAGTRDTVCWALDTNGDGLPPI